MKRDDEVEKYTEEENSLWVDEELSGVKYNNEGRHDQPTRTSGKATRSIVGLPVTQADFTC